MARYDRITAWKVRRQRRLDELAQLSERKVPEQILSLVPFLADYFSVLTNVQRLYILLVLHYQGKELRAYEIKAILERGSIPFNSGSLSDNLNVLYRTGYVTRRKASQVNCFYKIADNYPITLIESVIAHALQVIKDRYGDLDEATITRLLNNHATEEEGAE